VYKIPPEWDEIEFARHFDHFGDMVHCSLVRDPDGSSKGFGFIGYTEQEAVRKAILGMDGLAVGPPLELPGKFLVVCPKKGEEHLLLPFPDCYPPPGKYGSEPTNNRAPPGGNLYVMNVPPEWREMDLYRHFIHYGSLSSVKVMMSEDGKESRGFGFVGFNNPVAAQRAISGMNGLCLFPEGGKRLQVNVKKGEEAFAQSIRDQINTKDPTHPDYDPTAVTEIETQTFPEAPESSPPEIRHAVPKSSPDGKGGKGGKGSKGGKDSMLHHWGKS
jgi:RNA recognition motif-containing protein